MRWVLFCKRQSVKSVARWYGVCEQTIWGRLNSDDRYWNSKLKGLVDDCESLAVLLSIAEGFAGAEVES